MAKLNKKHLSGMIGNLVFYQLNGETVARARPEKNGKKKGSSKQNDLFRTMTVYGSRLLRMLKTMVKFRIDLKDFNAGKSLIFQQYKYYKDKPDWPIAINAFPPVSINSDTEFPKVFQMQLRSGDEGNIGFMLRGFNPKEVFNAPAHTTQVKLYFIGVSCAFTGHGPALKYASAVQAIRWEHKTLQDFHFDLELKANPGEVVLLAFAVEFIVYAGGESVVCLDRKFLPAALIGMGEWAI